MDILKKRDIVLDGFVLITLSLGLLSLFTISDYYFTQQLIFASLGLLLYFFIPFIGLHWYRFLIFLFYIIIILSLLYLYAFGQTIRGAVSWIDLGFFNFQPSEFSKFLIIFLCSSFISRPVSAKFKIFLLLLFSFPIVILTLIQPDLGTAIVLLFSIFFILFSTLFNFKSTLFTAIIFLLIAFFGFNLLAPYQKLRITSFLNPEIDPLGSGYNVVQSQIAIGSAGLWGKGFRQNTQVNLNFLPEPHTDFVFAGATEAYGLFYSFGLILLLFAFVFWIYTKYVFYETRVFCMVFALGTASVLFLQVFLNIGMNLGLLPITGLTLPLISYGGSSLLVFLFLFGFLQLFNIEK